METGNADLPVEPAREIPDRLRKIRGILEEIDKARIELVARLSPILAPPDAKPKGSMETQLVSSELGGALYDVYCALERDLAFYNEIANMLCI